ncbi:SDR family oxidoreductase [Nakamurella silvestris]|nr:SDR family oxidoreductase [Nakamurella silvestris]
MRVFVTGSTGWIGTAAVDDLLRAGHEVLGLARSDAAARTLEQKGAIALRGDLDDLDALRRGSAESDAVVHLANKHDWSNPAESNRAERAAVQAIADALVGTDHPFVLASGLLRPGHEGLALETDDNPAVGAESMRGGSENLALEYLDHGVRSIALRFAPSVHGVRDHGFIASIVAVAQRTGVSGYVGDGSTAWSAVHRSDAAQLVRLAVEQAPAGARLHAVAEERVTSKAIAEAIGEVLNLPAVSIDPGDADTHFGFIGRFFGTEMTGSSAATRDDYHWVPSGPTLLSDIGSGAYTP